MLNGEDDKLAAITKAAGIRPLFYGFLRDEEKEGVCREIYVDEIVNCGLKGVKACIHTPKGKSMFISRFRENTISIMPWQLLP